MKLQRSLISTLILAVISLGGCVYCPKTVEQHDNPSCIMITKKLELEANTDLIDIFGNGSCSGEGCAEFLAATMVVAAGSYIVSGSIVLAGNVLHWVEATISCQASDASIKELNPHHSSFVAYNARSTDTAEIPR